MKKFQYVFWSKYCADCNLHMVEDFWIENDSGIISRNGCHCRQCQKSITFEMTPEKIWLERVAYILKSKEVSFVRTVSESELIKKHGMEAHWFHIGRTVYIDAIHSPSMEPRIIDFKNQKSQNGMTLVYMLNSHLQRLYFFVASDAII